MRCIKSGKLNHKPQGVRRRKLQKRRNTTRQSFPAKSVVWCRRNRLS